MQTKAPNPINSIPGKKTLPIIQTYFEFNQLKHLYRQGWLKRGVPEERCESVAEHTLGVAILAMMLAESTFPELDANKIIRMALIHDFGEIYTGDIIPVDGVSTEEKHHREQEAVLQVLGRLPNGAEYIALWEEFEACESPEAKFIRQIDRLEMGFQSKIYELQGVLHTDEFTNSARRALTDENLQQILAVLDTFKNQQS